MTLFFKKAYIHVNYNMLYFYLTVYLGLKHIFYLLVSLYNRRQWNFHCCIADLSRSDISNAILSVVGTKTEHSSKREYLQNYK
jgi:hypothetical protein